MIPPVISSAGVTSNAGLKQLMPEILTIRKTGFYNSMLGSISKRESN